MAKYNFPPSRIWNTDETGIPTVLAPPKLVAVRGLQQVQQTVSRERGVHTTMIAFISASATHIPPVFIFPHVKFISRMTERGPPGCLGLAHPSGWVNKETFFRSLQHFVEFTMCSKTNPHLLFLDNHSSHLDPEVIKYAKENGIILLTFPPHSSHKLQPLDVSMYGPFKAALKTPLTTGSSYITDSEFQSTKSQSWAYSLSYTNLIQPTLSADLLNLASILSIGLFLTKMIWCHLQKRIAQKVIYQLSKFHCEFNLTLLRINRERGRLLDSPINVNGSWVPCNNCASSLICHLSKTEWSDRTIENSSSRHPTFSKSRSGIES